MIITEIYNGQGLGNQLWCYTVTRAIAKANNYKFGIMHPERFKCLHFMNLDLGEPVIGGEGPESGPPTSLPEGIVNYYVEKNLVDPNYPTSDIRIYDHELMTVSDNTKIDGCMQDERYIINYRDDIKEWLKVNNGKECLDYSDDNICVINFRGGEYVNNYHTFLPQSYWKNAIAHMRNKNPNFKFVVITDDVYTAKYFFPDFDVFHFDIGKDYSVINNAKYLIISNSSFAWFPTWTNDKLQLCIAPKFWARHNISIGFWTLGYALTYGQGKWLWQDREGQLSDFNACANECNDYIINNKNLYTKYENLRLLPIL